MLSYNKLLLSYIILTTKLRRNRKSQSIENSMYEYFDRRSIYEYVGQLGDTQEQPTTGTRQYSKTYDIIQIDW